MPFSSTSGKAWLIDRLSGATPRRVLDVGAGSRTYASLFRDRWPGSTWTAVEIWPEWVEKYQLCRLYDDVIVADARTWEPDGTYDVVFLGDVLEHMTAEEARALLYRMCELAETVVVSVPLGHYPQGAWGGNPYEAHVVDDWTHEAVIARLGSPSAFTIDQEIGVYIYRQAPPRPLRVAVYAIALNEAAHAVRWIESAKDADYLVVADTGSTDGTQAVLREAGVAVHAIHVRPWRFDVARNASLALIPQDVDYCIALDLDEVLLPGWKAELEVAHRNGWTRPRYRYVWSWTADGAPDLVYSGDKIHARTGYRWRHPVHEVLTPYAIPESSGHVGLEIHHHPDSSKGRGQYLPLLELAVAEDPNDDRNAHYYARDLMYAGRLQDSAKEFKRHLALPTARWKPERAASMRYLAKCEPERRLEWLWRATEEAPGLREPWVELAEAYYARKAWAHCYAAATTALAIASKDLVYLTEAKSWGALPHDLAAIAAHHLGRHAEAERHGSDAAAHDPGNERLVANLSLYRRTKSTP